MKVKKNTLSMSHYHTITVTEYVYILKFINNLKRIKFINADITSQDKSTLPVTGQRIVFQRH